MKILSYLYGCLAFFYRNLFEKGILKKTKVHKRVLSVGNLSMGGSGKTPLVLFLYDELVKLNKNPAIICRSYKASLKNSEVVPVDGDPTVYGDEALYYKTKRPQAVVISGPSKLKSSKMADQIEEVDSMIIDDGFQHHQLSKDWNAVVIDLSVSAQENQLIPLGRFREPWSTLKYADTVFFSRADIHHNQEVEKLVKKFLGDHPTFKILSSLKANLIDNKKYLLVSAIGRPEQFVQQMKNQFPRSHFLNMDYPDHYSYTQKDIDLIEKKLADESFDQVLCTEKDFVKIKTLRYNQAKWQPVEQNLQIKSSVDWNSYMKEIMG